MQRPLILRAPILPMPLTAIFLLLCSLWTCGCGMPSPNLLLPDEPEGVQTVLDVRQSLLESRESGVEGPESRDHAEQGGHDVGKSQDEQKGHDEHGEQDEQADQNGHDEGEGQGEKDTAHDQHDGPDHSEHHDDHSGAGHHPTEPAGPIEVVMVGRIGGLPNPWQKTEPGYPFVAGEAKFFLADPGAVAEHEGEGHGHAAGEECAFCAAHAADSTSMLAVVQFKDKNGQVYPRDARQWFNLKGSETVVVHGKARLVEGGLLVVDADGLYIRR